jgi:hypothetical protein
MQLTPHPRLLIGKVEQTRLRRAPRTECLRVAQSRIAEQAEEWARMPPLTFRLATHNSFLLRAREVQTRILTLLARWHQTQDPRFRAAIIDYVRMIGDWECWSWITWRKDDFAPASIFDLSYGENSATLALAYDGLHGTLSPAERALFLDTAMHWSFAAGAVHCRPGAAWWFAKPDSNWNTVCAGGLGLLCLAMYDDLPVARKLLPLVERSIAPFMRHLDKIDGAWPEGVGYWNYGMCYAFMYLLSWQKATGRTHPLMKLKGTRKTLSFPLDFSPYGVACSFGDVNSWTPLPFHYAVARDLRVTGVMRGIDAMLRRQPDRVCQGGWASPVGWLAFHDDRLEPAIKPRPCGVKLYAGLDWAVLADRLPEPGLFMSLRGGSTKVPHGHCDLLSFNVVVKDEKLIANVGNAEYLDTTFSPRRYDLPDINAQYKNTILINGVGVAFGAELVSTRAFNRPGAAGVRLDATGTMGLTRGSEKPSLFCGRLVILLKGKAFLIVDRVVTRHPARIESRLHTHAAVREQRQGAVLRGKQESLRLAYAATVPALLASATTAPTTPTVAPARMLRWCTQALHTDMTLATLVTPGSGAARVALDQKDGKLTARVTLGKSVLQVRMSDKLVFLGLR